MPSERAWVASLVDRLDTAVQSVSIRSTRVTVQDGKKLPYSHEVLEYDGNRPRHTDVASYETDLLVFDQASDSTWIPRVVIECKLGGITTHDALTYSAKAATHKQVHPHLRYGILIGNRADYAIPGRLFRHGAYFDFMATWKGEQPSDEEWYDLVGVLAEEVKASRKVQELLTTTRSPNRTKYTLVHRQMRLE